MSLLFIVSLIFFWYGVGHYLSAFITKVQREKDGRNGRPIDDRDCRAINLCALLGPILVICLSIYFYTVIKDRGTGGD